MTVTITRVQQQLSGLWLVKDSTGTTHVTKSPWLASLADRFREAQTPVEVFSSAGWYYRDLWAIKDPTATVEPPARICAWCDTVLSEGTRPASHTMCEACLAKAEADLEAKAQ